MLAYTLLCAMSAVSTLVNISGHIPRSQKQGYVICSSIANCIYCWVLLMAMSSMLALQGHVHSECRSVSGSVLHLGHILDTWGYISCTLAAGQHASAMTVSKAALLGTFFFGRSWKAPW